MTSKVKQGKHKNENLGLTKLVLLANTTTKCVLCVCLCPQQ